MENNQNPNPTPENGGENKPSNYETIDSYLSAAKVALTNSSHPQIAPVLAEYGYPDSIIAEGLALHTDAEKKQKDQVKEYGEQYTATDALAKAIAAANAPYIEQLELSRIAFKNQRGVLAELAATGERKKNQAGWLSDATTFYSNLLAKPEYVAVIAKFGQTKEKLNTAFDLIKAANAALAARTKESGEAQTATKLRDAAIDLFDEWYSDFIAVAKIALKNKPELLEILGIKQ
jgi:hypothetical protein